MPTEDFEQAQNLSSQVEQARQRAVLAASDAGAARDDAWNALHAAREHANATSQVVDGAERARDEAQAAADRAEAPTDSMVAELAGNPVSLTRAAVDQATGDMINTGGSTTQAAGDARWVTKAGADILVAAEIERTGSETQVSGDNRWVTNEGADNMVSALFNAPNSAAQTAADNRYSKRGEIVVNVRDFGAVGDGVTDDTDAFQAAMDMAWGSFGQGGKVLIPPGDYWPRLPVKLREGVNVEGQGWPILRRRYGDPFYAIFVGLSEGRRGYGSGPSNWTASGIEFRGSFKVGADRSLGAFALHHVQNAIIEKNRFIECHSKGHVFDLNACDNILIRNNVFKGMWIDDGNGVAEAIQLDQSKNGSLSYADSPGSFDGLMSRNITVEKNEFLPYVDADGIWYPASNIGGNHTTRQGVYYENIKILDNYVEDPILTTSHAFRGNLHFQGTKGLEIRGNKWVSTRGGNAKMISILTVEVGNGLDNDPEVVTPVGPIPPQGCLDVTIEDNEFEGFSGTASTEYMIHVWGVAGAEAAMSGISIRNNRFRDNFSTGTGSDPIRVQYASEVSIEVQKLRGKNSRILYAIGVLGLSILMNKSEWSETQPFWVEACVAVQIIANEWKNANNNPRARGCTDLVVSQNNATKPRNTSIGFVLEACTRFRVGPNNFSTTVAGTAGVALSGSANTQGTIDGNNCYGYTTAVQGTGVGVTIGTNPN